MREPKIIRHDRLRAAGFPRAPDDQTDLSRELLRGFSKFSSAEDLREYLTRLLALMAKGGVSPPRLNGWPSVQSEGHPKFSNAS